MKYNQKANLQRIALLTPGVLLYGIFNFLPLLGLLVLALVKWPGIGPIQWVGFENFQILFGNPYFRDQLVNAFLNNIVFFVIIIGAMLILGTGLALLLSFGTWGRNHYRTVFFLPYPLAGATSSKTPFSRSFPAITLVAEPVIKRGNRKRVSKQAPARPPSSSDEVPSRKDWMAGVGLHPCVGHPTMNTSTPCNSRGCLGSNRTARASPNPSNVSAMAWAMRSVSPYCES